MSKKIVIDNCYNCSNVKKYEKCPLRINFEETWFCSISNLEIGVAFGDASYDNKKYKHKPDIPKWCDLENN